jgi:hypothetical protein
VTDDARRRPQPGGRGADTNVNDRRRLGRFFESGEPGDESLPAHFPGVPRPDQLEGAQDMAEPAPDAARPRPRPRPGR